MVLLIALKINVALAKPLGRCYNHLITRFWLPPREVPVPLSSASACGRRTMSERERLLTTAPPAGSRGGSASFSGGTSIPVASSNLGDGSLDARRRATTRKFQAQAVALLGVCAVILSCHTQLASVKFGSRDTASDDPSLDTDAAGRLDPAAQKLLAHEIVVAAAGSSTPASQLYRGRYPSWWNDTSSLPDAQPIFIHIPKTGGVSVEDLASKSGHVTGACVVHSFGDASLPYALAPGFAMEPYHAPPRRFVPYSFTVVRDPYARMVSEFNWRAFWDPVKKADLQSGKWSFTCGEFEDFVATRVDGVASNAYFKCLAATDLNESDYDRCFATHGADPVSDSHALPQWLLAKNAERVFRYENYETEVWPWLRSTGVVGPKSVSEKINSAGSVSEIASKCWAFVSKQTLSKFVALYAMDFKNLEYDPSDLGKDAAAAALAAAAGGAAALGAAQGRRRSVDVREMIDRSISATLGLTEREKETARATVMRVAVTGDVLAALTAFSADGALGDFSSAPGATPHGESIGTDEMRDVAGDTGPSCASAGEVTALGHDRDTTTEKTEKTAGWTPEGWAVAEGTLRRATFAAQKLAHFFKSDVALADAAISGEDMAGMGGTHGAVVKARAAARRARWAAEHAARDPLGEGSWARVDAAGAAALDFANAFGDLAKRAKSAGSAAPQSLTDACVSLEAQVALFGRVMAQAVQVRRSVGVELLDPQQSEAGGEAGVSQKMRNGARVSVLEKSDDAAAALSGHAKLDPAQKLVRFQPDTAGLNLRRREVLDGETFQ
jgi:hypothetical protein